LFPTLGGSALDVCALILSERLTTLSSLEELARFVEVNRLAARLAVERCEAEEKKAGEKDAFHGIIWQR
jgi:hypothetical protein